MINKPLIMRGAQQKLESVITKWSLAVLCSVISIGLVFWCKRIARRNLPEYQLGDPYLSREYI